MMVLKGKQAVSLSHSSPRPLKMRLIFSAEQMIVGVRVIDFHLQEIDTLELMELQCSARRPMFDRPTVVVETHRCCFFTILHTESIGISTSIDLKAIGNFSPATFPLSRTRGAPRSMRSIGYMRRGCVWGTRTSRRRAFRA